MDLDGAVRSRVGDASQNEAITNLVVVQKGLFGLVDGTLLQDTGAGGARSGTARVWKVDSLFLGGIDNENIIGTLDGLVNALFLGNELDGVTQSTLSAHVGHDRGKGGGRADKSEDSKLEHGG